MFETPDSGQIEKGFLVLKVVWAAMLGSLFVYVFICYQWGDEIRRTASPDLPLGLLRNVLYAVSGITLVLAYFLRKLMLSGRSNRSEANGFTSPPTPIPPQFLAKYSTAVIVSLALSESIGIYGLVLFFLGDEVRTLHIFIGASALAIFFNRPKREELEAMAINNESDGSLGLG